MNPLAAQDAARDRPPDWERLRAAARQAAGRAYAPYSGLMVGAAGLTSDGRVLAACNVENASFGLTLCAECGLVAMARAEGCAGLVAVSLVTGDGHPLAPCGRCRQVLFEHGGAGLLIDVGASAAPVRLKELLPGAFGPDDLGRHRPPKTAPS